MKALAGYAEGRDNNLNLIRVVAAACVLISHAHPIALGAGAVEPLSPWIGKTLGTVSVYVFFVISGFLITQSFDRSTRVANWLAARILRLFPGLFVVLMLTALILGPLTTTLPVGDYFSRIEVPLYVLRNTTMVLPIYDLPGVFETNAYPGAINGSLWTLLHEVICYLGVLIAGLFGLVGGRWRLTAVLGLYLAGYVALGVIDSQTPLPGRLMALRALSLPFAIGMLFYAWRDRLPLSWLAGVVLAVTVALLRSSPVFNELLVLAIAYWTFLLGYLPQGAVRAYNKIGDYSYGIYIYAFPMQQLMVFSFGPMTPVENMVLAAPCTLVLAILSWHLVEKPSLAQKGRLSAWLTRLNPVGTAAPRA